MNQKDGLADPMSIHRATRTRVLTMTVVIAACDQFRVNRNARASEFRIFFKERGRAGAKHDACNKECD